MTTPPSSGSSYIIICNGRIAVLLAKGPEEKIRAVSQCATEVCAYIGTRYRGALDHADLKPIQGAQHSLMDMLAGKLDNALVDEKVMELFEMFEVLEYKYDSGAGSY